VEWKRLHGSSRHPAVQKIDGGSAAHTVLFMGDHLMWLKSSEEVTQMYPVCLTVHTAHQHINHKVKGSLHVAEGIIYVVLKEGASILQPLVFKKAKWRSFGCFQDICRVERYLVAAFPEVYLEEHSAPTCLCSKSSILSLH
jgi:hypothetical protein